MNVVGAKGDTLHLHNINRDGDGSKKVEFREGINKARSGKIKINLWYRRNSKNRCSICRFYCSFFLGRLRLRSAAVFFLYINDDV